MLPWKKSIKKKKKSSLWFNKLQTLFKIKLSVSKSLVVLFPCFPFGVHILSSAHSQAIVLWAQHRSLQKHVEWREQCFLQGQSCKGSSGSQQDWDQTHEVHPRDTVCPEQLLWMCFCCTRQCSNQKKLKGSFLLLI